MGNIWQAVTFSSFSLNFDNMYLLQFDKACILYFIDTKFNFAYNFDDLYS